MSDAGPTEVRELEFLLSEVRRTQAAQREQQQRIGNGAEALAGARWATLQALEDYARALEQRCWPVPRQIHQALQLHRALCGLPGSLPPLR